MLLPELQTVGSGKNKSNIDGPARVNSSALFLARKTPSALGITSAAASHCDTSILIVITL